MRCSACGSRMRPTESDLPLKVSERSIVILKQVPVLQCGNCAQFLLEDEAMARVDEILDGIDSSTELEIIRYAA